MTEKYIYSELLEALRGGPVCNTHSHHMTDDADADLDLTGIVRYSYVNWIYPDFVGSDIDMRKKLFEIFRCNSYTRWLLAGLEAIYPIGDSLSFQTWDDYDKAVCDAHNDPDFHLRILRDTCRYDGIILDQFPDPGSDNDHPELFSPTYRTDSFFMGYDPTNTDHNGISPYAILDMPHDVSLSDYISAVQKAIFSAKEKGHLAIKMAIAYERDLNFGSARFETAKKAFHNPDASLEDIRHFQDYLMEQILLAAAQCQLPVQIHTGLGQLIGTRAMGLCNLVMRHPDVRFDLFHASFPWSDDVLALAHNFSHVYINLCWLPQLSTTRAVTFTKEALEVADAGRLLWGCDTWTSEESYGALMGARHILATALGDMVADGAIAKNDAIAIGKRILYENARELFDFKRKS